MTNKGKKKQKKFIRRPVPITEEMLTLAEEIADAAKEDIVARYLADLFEHGLEVSFSIYEKRASVTIMERPEIRGGVTYAVGGYGDTWSDALIISYFKWDNGCNRVLRITAAEADKPPSRFG